MYSQTAETPTPTANPPGRAIPLRAVLILLGILLAFSGQQVLSRARPADPALGRLQLIGGSLLIAGALTFGAAAAPLVKTVRDRDDVAADLPGDPPAPRFATLRLAVPLLLSSSAILLFNFAGEGPLVRAVWIAGILGLLVVSVWRLPFLPSRPTIGDWWHFLALLAILIVYVISRVLWLSDLPLNLDGDFASVGLQARALLGAEDHFVFGFGWAAMPLLGYLPTELSLTIFGDSLAALNASGAVQGLLVVLGVYLLGRELFQPRFGLFAAALLVVALAFLSVSRQCVYIDPLGFMLFSIYFLIIGYRRGLHWAMSLGGILGGFSLLMYYSGRLLLPIVAVLVLYLWMRDKSVFRDRLGLLALWILGVLVTLGPMLLLFARYTDATLSRTREVFILHPAVVTHLMGVYHVDSVLGILLENARRSALLFNYYPDTSTQFGVGRPLLDVISGPLFVLGVGVAVFRLRRLGPFLILAWTAMGVIAGAFLTNNSPFWPRLVILIPPALMLAALGLHTMYDLLVPVLHRLGRPAGIVAPLLVALLVAAIGALNWSTYVKAEGSWADGRSRIGRYLLALPADAPAYVVSNGYNFRDREFDFLIPGRIVANIDPLQLDATVPYLPRPSIVILTPEHASLVADLQRLMPDGRLEIGAGNSPGEIAFYAFHAP